MNRPSLAGSDEDVQQKEYPIKTKAYKEILDYFGMPYKSYNYYWQVGEILGVQGWLLHISTIRSQIVEMLKVVTPILRALSVPFRLVKDDEMARVLLDGNFGYAKVGKILTLYPENEEVALDCAEQLVALTRAFKGPVVLTDIPLGGCVYTRYGGFMPVFRSDLGGREHKYIYDDQGQLVEDEYKFPFTLMAGITWPFARLAKPEVAVVSKVLKKIYRPVETLKMDPKGNVLKSLYLRKLFMLNWVVIKEGKANMWSDVDGRDMKDRLNWQKTVHEALQRTIKIPRVIDFFEENGNDYLVIEWIKGISLLEKYYQINRASLPWHQLASNKKTEIIEILLQVTEIVRLVHDKGFVHRDITPVNFLVKNNNQLYLIDNEMAYSITNRYPSPPFMFGTPGFMSPEQVQVQTPTVKEDIYALGALILSFIVGLAPATMEVDVEKQLGEELSFFINDDRLQQLICACLNRVPTQRPELKEIAETLMAAQKALIEEKEKKENHLLPVVGKSLIKEMVNRALKGLTESPTIIADKVWLSRMPAAEELPGLPKTEYEKSIGFFRGVAGALYAVGRAAQAGLRTAESDEVYRSSWAFLSSSMHSLGPKIPPGLYGGAAGYVMATVTGMSSGLLDKSSESLDRLKQFLELPVTAFDLGNGAAGQGIAALACTDLLGQEVVLPVAAHIAGTLLEIKENKQYWISMYNEKNKNSYATSLGYGNTGILIFLLQYANEFKEQHVLASTLELLELLEKASVRISTAINKHGARQIVAGDPNIWDGFLGTVLTFLKAFEITRLERYSIAATALLELMPECTVHENLMQETGLAGLGELYLEAYRILGNKRWQYRADWIAATLFNMRRQNQTGGVYWLGANVTFPTADLLVGNGGIIHFLTRYLYPQIGFRIID